MTYHTVIFYILAALILGSTLLAVTRRFLVHTVVYLVLSFFGTALLFYQMGAPVLAVLEVIIYAGAIMILFLFIVMMIRSDTSAFPPLSLKETVLPITLAVLFLALSVLVVLRDPGSGAVLETAVASPRAFGAYVFRTHWISVEIISLLLLIVLVGALHLGQERRGEETGEGP